MKMNDFKALPLEEQLIKLNNHLLNLKNMGGRLEDNFKSGKFDFSYSLLKKNANELGITVDGKNYVAFKMGDKWKQDLVIDKQNKKKQSVKQKQSVVKRNDAVNQQQVLVEKESIELTNDELFFVKELFKNKQDVVMAKQHLLLKQFVGAKKTTGISVYVELWERWGEFKKKYPMYSGTDLMAQAIEEFMGKYEGSADS
ncbi:hypothetical protein [Solibacillus sp. FSL W7-1324]|uniref:hypothetical protein n=1 Tax=Solibacillus sp. FSL W7-1324 TaxID=2921701 RepID=UPI0030FC72DD